MIEDVPLFPIAATQAAVTLVSGAGPAPAADAGETRPLWAQMSQVDQETGLRGWMLNVQVGHPQVWPRHHFSRGVRPPLIQAREEALRSLGYEPTPGAQWRWSESTTLDQKSVLMYASITVRALPADEAGLRYEAAAAR